MSTEVMQTPFQKSHEIPKRLKLFLWGSYGTLKTRTALGFPNACVIDTEGSTNIYANEFLFDVKHTSNPDSIMEIIDWLLKEKHSYKTLIIDPITIYVQALYEKWYNIFMIRMKGAKGYKGEFYQFQPGDWQLIKREIGKVFRKLNALDMNLVITAREKTLYSDSEFMKKIGTTFDGDKCFPHEFDTVLHTYKQDGKFMALTEKDRNHKLKEGEPFELSYSYIEQKIGKDVLCRETKQVKFITEEQKAEIVKYFSLFNLQEDQILNRLLSYDADSIGDLTEENAKIIISKLSKSYEDLSKI